ncbi:hypothetical protein CPter291_4842 [Collimonas pratensis]|uniref:Uncharacterized protein n=1 Tax=Collimonas pratensis TaxID=279113 RepID=A0ABM5ZCU2_9BURK|nr:hypothetical protein CPter291_4842 [Collimonas pratensis]
MGRHVHVFSVLGSWVRKFATLWHSSGRRPLRITEGSLSRGFR